jgi:YVTN family beta-propeller protein
LVLFFKKEHAFFLLAFLLLAFSAHAENLAFVINSNDASVSVIDIGTHQVVRTIPMLREPHHMALTPDHRSLVIGDTAGNALFFLDPRTGAVQRRVVVSDPYQIQYSPNGRYLTVAGLACAAASDSGAQHAESYQLFAGFGASFRKFAGHG